MNMEFNLMPRRCDDPVVNRNSDVNPTVARIIWRHKAADATNYDGWCASKQLLSSRASYREKPIASSVPLSLYTTRAHDVAHSSMSKQVIAFDRKYYDACLPAKPESEEVGVCRNVGSEARRCGYTEGRTQSK